MPAMVRGLVAVLCLCALAPAASAEIAIYQCALRTPERSWIADRIVIGREIGSDRATINDRMTVTFTGGPVTGRVADENPRRTTFAWEVPVVTRFNDRARMLYRGSYLSGSDRFVVSAQVLGRGANYQARGRCVRTTGAVPDLPRGR